MSDYDLKTQKYFDKVDIRAWRGELDYRVRLEGLFRTYYRGLISLL